MKKKHVDLPPMNRMLQFHKKSCSYYRYSDGPARLNHCSCGRNEAVEQYRMLLKMAFLFVKYNGVNG
jgi:hypothetical protein